MPECRVTLSTAQLNLVDGTWTLVLYDTEQFDIGSNFNTGTHKFIAPIPGKYQIVNMLNWVDTSIVADKSYATAYLVGVIYQQVSYQQASMVGSVTNTLLDVVTLAIGDEVTIWAKSNAGVNTIDIQAALYYPVIIKLISKT